MYFLIHLILTPTFRSSNNVYLDNNRVPIRFDYESNYHMFISPKIARSQNIEEGYRILVVLDTKQLKFEKTPPYKSLRPSISVRIFKCGTEVITSGNVEGSIRAFFDINEVPSQFLDVTLMGKSKNIKRGFFNFKLSKNILLEPLFRSVDNITSLLEPEISLKFDNLNLDSQNRHRYIRVTNLYTISIKIGDTSSNQLYKFTTNDSSNYINTICNCLLTKIFVPFENNVSEINLGIDQTTNNVYNGLPLPTYEESLITPSRRIEGEDILPDYEEVFLNGIGNSQTPGLQIVDGDNILIRSVSDNRGLIRSRTRYNLISEDHHVG